MVGVSCCLLELPNNKLVFQRRTTDAPVSAHKLDFFGGHHEPGESYEETIKRELAEETSLNVGQLKIKYLGTYDNSQTGTRMHFYLAHILKSDFHVYEGEAEEVYSLEQVLARTDLDPDTRVLLDQYRNLKSRS